MKFDERRFYSALTSRYGRPLHPNMDSVANMVVLAMQCLETQPAKEAPQLNALLSHQLERAHKTIDGLREALGEAQGMLASARADQKRDRADDETWARLTTERDEAVRKLELVRADHDDLCKANAELSQQRDDARKLSDGRGEYTSALVGRLMSLVKLWDGNPGRGTARTELLEVIASRPDWLPADPVAATEPAPCATKLQTVWNARTGDAVDSMRETLLSSCATLHIFDGPVPANADELVDPKTRLLSEAKLTREGEWLRYYDTAADQTGTASFARVYDAKGVPMAQLGVRIPGEPEGAGELLIATRSIMSGTQVAAMPFAFRVSSDGVGAVSEPVAGLTSWGEFTWRATRAPEPAPIASRTIETHPSGLKVTTLHLTPEAQAGLCTGGAVLPGSAKANPGSVAAPTQPADGPGAGVDRAESGEGAGEALGDRRPAGQVAYEAWVNAQVWQRMPWMALNNAERAAWGAAAQAVVVLAHATLAACKPAPVSRVDLGKAICDALNSFGAWKLSSESIRYMVVVADAVAAKLGVTLVDDGQQASEYVVAGPTPDGLRVRRDWLFKPGSADAVKEAYRLLTACAVEPSAAGWDRMSTAVDRELDDLASPLLDWLDENAPGGGLKRRSGNGG